MEDAGSSGSRTSEILQETLGAENGCKEVTKDYLRLAYEAMERVQELTSPELSRSLHLNQAQCRLLRDALSNAVQSAKQDIHGLDPSSVRQLCAPAFRELCRVAGDCEKLVRDCCKENWFAVAILLADSRQDFLLRVSELKWCTKAWRVVLKHGLQGGAWLEQFHKCSKTSVGDRRTDECARFKNAADEDLKTLISKLLELQGRGDVDTEVRECASYVMSRCEMIGTLRPHDEQSRRKYDLSRLIFDWRDVLEWGSLGPVLKCSWFQEHFAAKFMHHGSMGYLNAEVAAMTKVGFHPRIARLLGVFEHKIDTALVTGLMSSKSDYDTALVMELSSSDLSTLMSRRRPTLMSMRLEVCDSSCGDGPFPLHVAVDIMLQAAEGVEFLHKHGLFHRDLKPRNFLVEPVGMRALCDEGYVRVKLADFGLAEVRSNTFGWHNRGTTIYMAPEIADSYDSTLVYPAKADTFSFALTCAEILSGETSFQQRLCFRLRMKKIREGFRPELPKALPSRLVSLLERCWDSEPTKRPTFATICRELRYLKFLLTIGGEMQVRALDSPEGGAEKTAEIVKHLRWIDPHELQFVRHLGSGGYGSVDECEWQGQRVAVKNLLRCSEKKCVEEEAALLVRVAHRNVVKLVGCAFNGEESKGMIVMELMDQDLHHLISEIVRFSQEPPFPLATALEILWKVATTMKHIRSCNVLHRDLKTTNILVKSRTRSCLKFGPGSSWNVDVKLADFGLSKHKLGDSMFTTRASEAQLWRAPETSEWRNYSWPADVFSFAVVCYEVLSGQVPFKGMLQGPQLLELVRGGKRPEMNPMYCPRDVAELVNACWATDPNERPDFAEICTKLESCLTTCKKAARPSTLSRLREFQRCILNCK